MANIVRSRSLNPVQPNALSLPLSFSLARCTFDKTFRQNKQLQWQMKQVEAAAAEWQHPKHL